MPGKPSLLLLALPHPNITIFPSSIQSPRTPRKSSLHIKPLSRSSRKSTDSWASSIDEERDSRRDWTQEEIARLYHTLDNLPSHLQTPFPGGIPPPNLLDKLARNIASSKENASGGNEWAHSVRATRTKLYELARCRNNQRLEDEKIVEDGVSKVPLHRKNSMDFIPEQKETMNLKQTSTRLQRTDRVISHAPFHPYARPSSRSPPNTSACTPTRVTRRRVYYTCPSTPTIPESVASPAALLTVSFAAQSISSSRTTRSSTRLLKRTESCVAPPSGPKRAPSFENADSLKKIGDNPRRKRAKVSSISSTETVTVTPKRLKRAPSFFGDELPAPPVAEPKPEQKTPRRTLRRVGVTSFSPSPSPPISPVSPPRLKRKETKSTAAKGPLALAVGRRISFGSGMGSGSGDGLQSPFEESMRF
ncbi:hypothetical protein BOTBODRAFT_173578 [Botryobasidium botryosum FD-172 SS1]|uniref:Uncharacterized protein n=1 Tax=Botryobasidium botryosum (strain FD-172 SS1) TaxID=930990 RepID=A0A067MK56_BOTB1|nr:hypothetical protein BOTBODRAFT_173578 [Botryobasidium botryosum FD-172 SS1]